MTECHIVRVSVHELHMCTQFVHVWRKQVEERLNRTFSFSIDEASSNGCWLEKNKEEGTLVEMGKL